ncbi:uncharacterized protein LOC142586821 [Dermacentor variabilis]|uniref:uncharacterized protein LOC142586821 n=1 Tax=Dermacentor variabilis TaxID=34621 RepID=UPI003F5B0023
MSMLVSKVLPKICLCLLVAEMANCHFWKKTKSTHVPVDAYRVIKMVASVPYMAAAYTSSSDPAYRCMTASLTSIDETKKEGTYSWYLKSPIDHRTVVKVVNFNVTPGSAPDLLNFTVEGGGNQVYTAQYTYTNYENCLVSKIPYNNDGLCILWVTEEVVDNIPHDCLTEYQATCPVEYRAYDSDIC